VIDFIGAVLLCLAGLIFKCVLHPLRRVGICRAVFPHAGTDLHAHQNARLMLGNAIKRAKISSYLPIFHSPFFDPFRKTSRVYHVFQKNATPFCILPKAS